MIRNQILGQNPKNGFSQTQLSGINHYHFIIRSFIPRIKGMFLSLPKHSRNHPIIPYLNTYKVYWDFPRRASRAGMLRNIWNHKGTESKEHPNSPGALRAPECLETYGIIMDWSRKAIRISRARFVLQNAGQH